MSRRFGIFARVTAALLLLLITGLTGCGQRQNENTESGYLIYYYDVEKMELCTERCDEDLCYDDVVMQAASMLYQMYYPTEAEHKSVFTWNSAYTDNREQKRTALNELRSGEVPQILGLSALEKDKRIINLRFKDESYYEMQKLDEVICRAAIVKTLLQISSVDYVGIYVNDQPLTIDSKVVGLMSMNNFITDTNTSLNMTDNFNTTVYYSDKDGKGLVGEKVTLQYSGKTSMEQTVIEKLIAGPSVLGSKPTLASNIKLLNISTKDGVCYVNFDAAFMTSIADVSAEVTLYSIVNSLCELTRVKKVQILVNGAQDGTFRDIYSLSATYERNLDIVTEVVKGQ